MNPRSFALLRLFLAGVLTLVLAGVAVGLFSRLDYNSPSNDEAVYVVIGRLGLFEHDWYNYNATAWVSGWQYIYPSLTALAYETGGITGSRALNAAIGLMFVEALLLLALHLSESGKQKGLVIGAITAAAIGYSPAFLYVARLATMDMLSFFFILSSLLIIVIRPAGHELSGKRYFFASILAVLGILTKYASVIVLPALAASGYMQGRSREERRLFGIYYIVPVVILLGFFVITNLPQLRQYYTNEVQSGYLYSADIVSDIWGHIRFLVPLAVLGTAGMIRTKKWRELLILLVFGATFPLYHASIQRFQTLDKHILLTLASMAVISGIGIPELISGTKKAFVRTSLVVLAVACFAWFVVRSGAPVSQLAYQWSDVRPVMEFFENNTSVSDRVLAESGAAIVLANYFVNHPEHVTTFDWFTYRTIDGEGAYIAALDDGYFTYVQLEHNMMEKEESVAQLSRTLSGSIGMNYEPVFDRDGYIVYKRVF